MAISVTFNQTESLTLVTCCQPELHTDDLHWCVLQPQAGVWEARPGEDGDPEAIHYGECHQPLNLINSNSWSFAKLDQSRWRNDGWSTMLIDEECSPTSALQLKVGKLPTSFSCHAPVNVSKWENDHIMRLEGFHHPRWDTVDAFTFSTHFF